MFGRFKGAKSTFVWADDEDETPSTKSALVVSNSASGVTVDPSCNRTITISCLQQMYNAVGFKPSAKENSIAITGYLEEFANIQDLQPFYADQRPDALNSSFNFIPVKGA